MRERVLRRCAERFRGIELRADQIGQRRIVLVGTDRAERQCRRAEDGRLDTAGAGIVYQGGRRHQPWRDRSFVQDMHVGQVLRDLLPGFDVFGRMGPDDEIVRPNRRAQLWNETAEVLEERRLVPVDAALDGVGFVGFGVLRDAEALEPGNEMVDETEIAVEQHEPP